MACVSGKARVRLHEEFQALPQFGCAPGLITGDRRQQSQGVDRETATQP